MFGEPCRDSSSTRHVIVTAEIFSPANAAKFASHSRLNPGSALQHRQMGELGQMLVTTLEQALRRDGEMADTFAGGMINSVRHCGGHTSNADLPDPAGAERVEMRIGFVDE